MDWLLRTLADKLGVEPACAGEAITPALRFEQPWPQWVVLLVLLASLGLIVGLYRREAAASLAVSPVPGEACGSRSSSSRFSCSRKRFCRSNARDCRTSSCWWTTRRARRSSTSTRTRRPKPPPRTSPSASGRPEVDRFAVASGFLSRDHAKVLREIQKQNKIRLYLSGTSTRQLAEIDRPEDVEPALESAERRRPVARADEARQLRPRSLDGTARRAAVGDAPADRRSDNRRRSARESRRTGRAERRAALYGRALAVRNRRATSN